MDKLFKNMQNANHIMIVGDMENLMLCSALYTYVLQLHKKVSWVCENQKIDRNLLFLPWSDKIRAKKTTSADLEVDLKCSCIELYDYFKKQQIKINPKMATALYAGLLQETDYFLNIKVNGTIFAIANELIECGANHNICIDSMQEITLASLRLKALLFKKMILQNDAKFAIFELSAKDFKSTGASLKDCDAILKESLRLPYVDQALLLDVDNEYNIIKLKIKEI